MNYLCSCSKYANVLLRQRNYYKNEKQKRGNIYSDTYSDIYNDIHSDMYDDMYNDTHSNIYNDMISYYDNFVSVQKYYFIYGTYEKKRS